MGSDIILCMALIASFAFVIQFLLSILGSDLDTDIDIDSASDLSMSLSDIISFKGITHFILGYSWTTYFFGFPFSRGCDRVVFLYRFVLRI